MERSGRSVLDIGLRAIDEPMLSGVERSRNLRQRGLTTPAVRPWMKLRWRNANSSNGGTITIAMPAKVSPWSVAYPVGIDARTRKTGPEGPVFLLDQGAATSST